ncbi:response regulator [Litchfieldia salsa]|uniref:Two component transcriptional regulator, AraC family n=1 Tax=Litchfieldia salsa TaxID=930152 RepID=A0A1H0Q020_9BACI|nr:response regulator [Litchfieldia salsa]SDP10713.1 two component transcriptional regulator, AraC family [Litchfieldia salsa]
MRLIIVDDEELERKGLSKMIQREMPEITILGEARNGRTAVELAEKLHPDVMLMDIKMPGMDGVEAVKMIREKNKDIKFIMISAFNTFEYAKGVMQEGVKEYILKPSMKDDVIGALRRVKKDLAEHKKNLEIEYKYNTALSLMESGWLSSLLLEQVEEMYLQEWNKLLNIEAVMGCIILFSFKGKNILIDKEMNKVFYNWLKKKQKDMDDDIVVGPMIDEKVPVLLLVKKTTRDTKVKAFARSYCRSVINQFNEQFSEASLKAGIGLPYQKSEDFIKSYHEAIIAFEQIRESEVSYGIISEEVVEKVNRQNIYEKENELLELIKLGDRTKLLHEFEIYFDGLLDQTNGEINQLVQAVEEFFVVISRDLYNFGYKLELKALHHEIHTNNELREASKERILEILMHVHVWKKSHLKGIIHKAKEFIDQRFGDTITLEEVADYVNLTPFYFSKIFKEKMGVTFIDYMTDVRIKFAKKEMIMTDKSLKEICFDCGYKDPNYFSRVFKKKTGETPKDYRQKYVKIEHL